VRPLKKSNTCSEFATTKTEHFVAFRSFSSPDVRSLQNLKLTKRALGELHIADEIVSDQLSPSEAKIRKVFPQRLSVRGAQSRLSGPRIDF
jgi:hypothetical protein